MVRRIVLVLFLTAAVSSGWAEPGPGSSPTPSTASLAGNPLNQASNANLRAEQVRNACIEGRRIICGRVVQVTPGGIVVDSGYKQLLSPPLDHNWVVPGTVSLTRDPNAVEEKRANAVCIGLVFLSNLPKRPAVKEYDYVVLHGYPAGEHLYLPVPGVEKSIRRFSASLEHAIDSNLEPPHYEICVSDEHSGEITIIDGADWQVLATIPVGKRPRGITASPDGKTVYVALSGTPISGPPQLDAHGNPILHKDDDDDDDRKADKSADGIAVVDLASRKLIKKLNVGSDPEQFALSKDGQRLFVSNEDVATASILNVASGKVEQIVPVHREPEGVGVTPDGRFFYVTCENDGEIFAVDTARYETVAHFNVGGRPRSIDFLPDGSRAFIPSESAGEVHLIDTAKNAVLKTVVLPKGCRPMCLKVAPDGSKIYVSTGRGGSICVLDPATLQLLDIIKVGRRPWGIAFSPGGKYLYSANGPSDDVSVVEVASQKQVARIPAGSSPWGVVVVPTPRGTSSSGFMASSQK